MPRLVLKWKESATLHLHFLGNHRKSFNNDKAIGVILRIKYDVKRMAIGYLADMNDF